MGVRKREPAKASEFEQAGLVDGEAPATEVKTNKRSRCENAVVAQAHPERESEADQTSSDASATNKKKVGRRTDRRSPEQLEAQLRDILRQATPSAARLLAQAIDNEELSISLRLACAKDILNRVYGKQAPPEEPKSVTFVLEEALHEYAR